MLYNGIQISCNTIFIVVLTIRSTGQDIPKILRNMRFHLRLHRIFTLISRPISKQINPAHNYALDFSMIHLNTKFPPMSGYSKQSHPSTFPNKAQSVRPQVLMATSMKTEIFWDVFPDYGGSKLL